MRALVVVVRAILVHVYLEVALVDDKHPVQAFRRQLPIQRSACAFALGAISGVRITHRTE